MSCNWPVDETCLPTIPEDDAAKRAQLQASVDLAVSVLWALSGRQFGQCPVKVRPCPFPDAAWRRRGELVGTGQPWLPMWTSAGWTNVSCGCGGGTCTESGPGLVHLPGPVGEIIEIAVGDVEIDPSAYTLEADRLYRRDGASWPSQDLSRPAGEPGTWSVTYTRGIPVPLGVGTLVGTLALEFYNQCTGGKCRIPRNVTSVNRKGVSYQMAVPDTMFADGKTGLAEVDRWLSAVNPNHIMQPPSVT